MGIMTRALDVLGGDQSGSERRSTLATPGDWLLNALLGDRSATGRRIAPEQSLNLAAVYACVSLLAETIASLPWILYRRLTPQGKERAGEHPLYRLLHDAPNPEMTSFEFREALCGHVETWGNAYAEIELDNAARPIALWPLRPDKMVVERANGLNRGLRYTYTVPSGRQFMIPSERVLHWRGLSPDGLVGYSRISLMREAVGLGLALEEYAARFFGNDSRPGGVLEHPGKLSEDAARRLKAGWESAHRGLDQAHRVAVLEEGIKWQSIGIPPQDAEFIAARQFQRNEIAMIFRVPPHMIGDVEKQTSWGTGVEQMSIGFVVFSLRPRLVRFETATTRALLTKEEQRTFFIEFLVDGLMRGDAKNRADALHVMRLDGIINADEWRDLENMNPIPGGAGQLYLAPLNLAPLASIGATPPPGTPGTPGAPGTPPTTPVPLPDAPPPGSGGPGGEGGIEGEASAVPVGEVREAVLLPAAHPNGAVGVLPPIAEVRATSREGVREYLCRNPSCRHLLFRTAEPRGRIETVCPDRRCRQLQTVLLGN